MMPSDSGEKITLGISAMLNMAVSDGLHQILRDEYQLLLDNMNTLHLKILRIKKQLRERCIEKKVKKLTRVSFAFTHTYTLEKLTLLLFSPSVHGKF